MDPRVRQRRRWTGWLDTLSPPLTSEETEQFARLLLALPDLDDDDRHVLRMAISVARMEQSRRHVIFVGRYRGNLLGRSARDVISIWTRYHGTPPGSFR